MVLSYLARPGGFAQVSLRVHQQRHHVGVALRCGIMARTHLLRMCGDWQEAGFLCGTLVVRTKPSPNLCLQCA